MLSITASSTGPRSLRSPTLARETGAVGVVDGGVDGGVTLT
jgi:hypothetical protein